MITLKINIATTQDYYSQTLIVYCMKVKFKISMKIVSNKEIFMIIQINQYLVKLMMKQLVFQ